MKIKWTNKFSNESGYVRRVSNKDKHFINTFDESEAKTYKTARAAEAIIERLTDFGEAESNEFEVVE